jgi:hypothetical protein
LPWNEPTARPAGVPGRWSEPCKCAYKTVRWRTIAFCAGRCWPV